MRYAEKRHTKPRNTIPAELMMLATPLGAAVESDRAISFSGLDASLSS
jgi:hypothetical protein